MTRSITLAYRLPPGRPLDMSLSPAEYASVESSAEAAKLLPGTYVRRLLSLAFGEKAREILALHAQETGLPVSVLAREVVLAAAGFPADDSLEAYRRLGRKAAREL